MRAGGGAGVRSRREASAPRLGCLALSKAERKLRSGLQCHFTQAILVFKNLGFRNPYWVFKASPNFSKVYCQNSQIGLNFRAGRKVLARRSRTRTGSTTRTCSTLNPGRYALLISPCPPADVDWSSAKKSWTGFGARRKRRSTSPGRATTIWGYSMTHRSARLRSRPTLGSSRS